MELNTVNLESIMKLLDGTSIEMFEMEKGRTRVKIVRRFAYQECPVETQPMNAAARQVVDVKLGEKGLYTVKSYMVGTFRRSNELSGKPLVEEGDEVNLDSPLCVIEAMKNLNEIRLKDYQKEFKAKGGVVHKILIGDESDVEFGTPLFSIIPGVIQ